jgi:hypothetical protein
LNNLIESIFVLFYLLRQLIKYIFFTFWKQLFSRLFICPLKGHDWYFVGGGWIFSAPKSFQCKKCGKYSDVIDKPYAKI